MVWVREDTHGDLMGHTNHLDYSYSEGMTGESGEYVLHVLVLPLEMAPHIARDDEVEVQALFGLRPRPVRQSIDTCLPKFDEQYRMSDISNALGATKLRLVCALEVCSKLPSTHCFLLLPSWDLVTHCTFGRNKPKLSSSMLYIHLYICNQS